MANEDAGPVVIDAHGHPVNAETVIQAYIQRCFPMSEERDGPLAWYRPAERAIITWDHFKVPRSLRKTAAKQPFRISHDQDFRAVIRACADRESTWIGHDIETLYVSLHEQGFAHSVEVWDADDLVGGLYGLSLGAAFCGESMFHVATDASKLAVLYLVTQFASARFSIA